VVDSVRGGAVEEDASLIGDLVTHGVVDKVVKYSSPKTNGMRVKIRLREDREPTGDKFSSRHGQKGNCRSPGQATSHSSPTAPFLI
jgi:DNA-directed RNA polymerase beta subunit